MATQKAFWAGPAQCFFCGYECTMTIPIEIDTKTQEFDVPISECGGCGAMLMETYCTCGKCGNCPEENEEGNTDEDVYGSGS